MSSKSTPEKELKKLKLFFGEFLKDHPEEKKNSTGYVHNHLEIKHVKAALWMLDHYGTRMNAHNLHDLIVHYDQYKMLAELSPSDMLVQTIDDIEPGKFDPAHLIQYFTS